MRKYSLDDDSFVNLEYSSSHSLRAGATVSSSESEEVMSGSIEKPREGDIAEEETEEEEEDNEEEENGTPPRRRNLSPAISSEGKSSEKKND